jgi:hypothetical protein
MGRFRFRPLPHPSVRGARPPPYSGPRTFSRFIIF